MSLVVLLLLAQDPPLETIPKQQRADYTRAVDSCREAERLLDSDPSRAVELLGDVLDNSKIAKRECRLKIEQAGGGYSDPINFFPYQLRGRARMRLGEKAKASGDKERARGYLEKAVEDLQTSVDKGVRSSAKYKTDAQSLLASLAGGEGPLKEFEAELKKQLDARNFAEAKRFVEGDRGKFLTDAQRKTYLDDATERSRVFVESETSRFVEGLKSIVTLKQLESMKDAPFDRSFALPARNTLIDATVSAEFVWCLDFLPTLRDLRAKKDVFEALLRGAVKLVPLAAKASDFDWFSGVERHAYELARAAISRKADDAKRESSADGRKRLRQEAEKIRDRWKAFEADVRGAAKGKEGFLSQIETRDFAAIFDRFPVEAAGIDEILAGVRKSADAEDPDRALADLETRLERFRDDWDRLLPDSRRDVLACRVVVASLRAFLDGRTVAQVAVDLKTLGTELKGLGGKADEKRFGRKVLLVFQELLK